MASEQEAEQIIRSLNSDIKLGKHIKNSAKRLLYEVLRFTNSRVFAKAIAAEKAPSVVFRVLVSDRIVIELNDDGLTKADLEAICGPASEEQPKGFDFKAIVVACKKVHIQSGNFSFEFQHNIFDLTDSLMRPVWVSPAKTTPVNLTRITLYLHDQGDKKDVENLRNIVHSLFEGLHEATPLFLKDLELVSIKFSDSSDTIYRSKNLRKEKVDEHRVRISVTSIECGEASTCSQLYHITEEPVERGTTEVILAFPLTDDFKPLVDDLITGQCFNFVPLHPSKYSFHVHSDFDFQDEQSNALVESIANSFHLPNQVASAFCRAILQFLEHPTLCYHWPLFLTRQQRLWDTFRIRVDIFIKEWIGQNPVLRSRNLKHWRLISHVARPGADFEDENNEPLLEDPMHDTFLSHDYPLAAALSLKDYGLAALTRSQFLDLLEIDLENPNSKMRTNTSKSWHSAVARLLSRILTDDECSRLKSLPLIQLTDGSWTSVASGPVYFPDAENSCLPEALNIRVASYLASQEPERKSLYRQLGVSQTKVIEVRQMILDSFECSGTLSLKDVQSYLHYLYLTHQSFTLENERPYRQVRVFTTDMNLQCPQSTVIHLMGTDDPYSLESFLDPALLVANLHASFLHSEISNNGPKQPSLFHPSWKSWLCNCVGIRERLSLTGPKSDVKSDAQSDAANDDYPTVGASETLSNALDYVSKHHKDKFLGILEHLWVFEGPAILKCPALVSKIKGLPALTLCSVDSSRELQITWFPSNHLKSYVRNFMEHPDEFPFLKLDEEKDINLALASKWAFLTKNLGVKWKYDLSFLLEILKSIRRHSGTALSSSQIEKVLALYATIGEKFPLSTIEDKEQALDFFDDSAIFYINDEKPVWTRSSSCLWAAPRYMVSADSIGSFYEKMSRDEQQLKDITNLFHNELNIQDATAEDLIQELSMLRDEGWEDVVLVAGIYRYLDRMAISSDMKRGFEKSELILVNQDECVAWFCVSDCFWSESDTTELNSSLKRCYPDLKDFFLDKLGVKGSAYDYLLSTTSKEPHDVKMAVLSFMEEVGDFVPRFPAKPVRTAKILPVRCLDGTVSLCSVETEFAITDREQLRKELGNKITVLDFDLKEVRRLWPFFKWLDIEDRYLSRCVKERVTISPNYSSLLHGSKTSDLRRKSYHIARVASTFDTYGTYSDAATLFHRLKTLRVVEVSKMSSALEMVQDEQIIRSTPKPTVAHISNNTTDFTIYVPNDKKAQQRCLFSALPRVLEKWLRQDNYSRHTSEVLSSLTSVIASDISVLDEILEDQGIIELPFERHDIDDTRIPSWSTRKIVVKLPGQDVAKTVGWGVW
ncbi:hypothetical protein BFJ69_g6997 [Fusarium oxysporum]|uniref:Uncharacterized protein n=1 Tax=Fusarium oxysporum TaxID=5507 RepID=A0A420N7Q5_FUSOX|nr:hypothetical protein BFJ69_g6997 [Fusarium oxysporum]